MKTIVITLIVGAALCLGCTGSTGSAGVADIDAGTPDVDGGRQLVEEVQFDLGVEVLDVIPDVPEVVPEIVEVAPEVVLPVPTGVILQPLNGKVLNVSLTAHFVGQVGDPNETTDMLKVRWESDVDGAFHESVPDAKGVAEFDYLGFTPGPHVITMTVTNSAGYSTAKSIKVTMNIPPIGPTVTIEPANPVASDDLHAVLVGEASDAEGADVEVLIDWFEDGEPANGFDGLLIVPAVMTKRGVTWSVVVRAFDGSSYGFAEQDKVTIGNTPPTISGALVEPDSGDMFTEFTCAAKSVSDADGDEVTVSFAWLVNDQPVPDQTEAIFPSGLLTKGDELVCQATPEDKWDAGEPALSPAVTIGNSKPTGGTALVEPPAGNRLTSFSCSAEGAVDPDGDDVTYLYSWVVNGDKIDGAEAQTLEGGQLQKGDILRCRVTPFDGFANGSWFDSNLVVLANIPPVVGGATLTPGEATAMTTFNCAALDSFDADDDLLKYKVVWTVAGEVVLGQTEEELAPGFFAKGEAVTCAISAWDGEEWSAYVPADESVVVANTLPTLESVSITPATGTEATTFSCQANGWFDPDSDDLFEVSYLWLVNNFPADNSGAGTIHGAYFDAGDEIVCQVTPKNGDELGAPVSSEPVAVTAQ